MERTTLRIYEHIVDSIHIVATEILEVNDKQAGKRNIPISKELKNLVEENVWRTSV